MIIPKSRGFGIQINQHTQKTSAYGVHLSCSGFPARRTWWPRMHWSCRKASECVGDDTAHRLLPVHSHLSHVLLSGVCVLLQLSPVVKMWSCNCLTSWDLLQAEWNALRHPSTSFQIFFSKSLVELQDSHVNSWIAHFLKIIHAEILTNAKGGWKLVWRWGHSRPWALPQWSILASYIILNP